MRSEQIVILAGGLGTRIREVSGESPKVMLEVGGRPFLEHLVRYVSGQGFREIVLAVGYRAEVIEEYFGNGEQWGVAIEYSKEAEPLGTGGAVIKASSLVSGERFIVMNGDTAVEVDLGEFVKFHRGSGAICSLVLHEAMEVGRFGSVKVGEGGRVLAFLEKVDGGVGERKFINAGVYCVEKAGIAREGKLESEAAISLERKIFPEIVKEGGLFGYVAQGNFVDMGVRSDYERICERGKVY